MLVTKESAKKITGKSFDEGTLYRAQSIIESYIGRSEVQIHNSFDKDLLQKAVAYQAAYMQGSEDIVFEQGSVSSTSVNDSTVTFKPGDEVSPWIAPLAVIACKKLSFKRSRSVATGKVMNNPLKPDWRTI
jgi:hypothetical protein